MSADERASQTFLSLMYRNGVFHCVKAGTILIQQRSLPPEGYKSLYTTLPVVGELKPRTDSLIENAGFH